MLRQQYQEKYVKSKKIKKVKQEIDEVFYLFEELYDEVKKQDKNIQTIEDTIENTKETTSISEEEIKEAEHEQKSVSYLYMLLGGGLGSFATIYNPYIGIGSIVGGMVLGGVFSYIY